MMRSRSLMAFLLIVYLATTYFFYASYVQGDFSIYYRAGQRVDSGRNLYLLDDNLYIYGPLLGIVMSLFADIDQLLVSRVWLLSNIISTVTACFIACKTYLRGQGCFGFLALTGIVALGFSFRNNLGNGNVMAHVLLCVALVIRLAPTSNSVFSLLVLPLITIFTFEVKPYIALFLMVYLLYWKRYSVLAICIPWALFLNLIYWAHAGSTYLNWVAALRLRAAGIQEGTDQATILVFASKILPEHKLIGISVALSLYTFIGLLVLSALMSTNPKNPSVGLLVFSAAPILTVFSHGQDFLLSTLSLGVVILNSNRVSMGEITKLFNISLALGLLINWTNQSVIPAFFAMALLILILWQIKKIKWNLIVATVLFFLLSICLNFYIVDFFGDIQYLVYNFQAMLFGLSCLLVVYDSQRKSRVA